MRTKSRAVIASLLWLKLGSHLDSSTGLLTMPLGFCPQCPNQSMACGRTQSGNSSELHLLGVSKATLLSTHVQPSSPSPLVSLQLSLSCAASTWPRCGLKKRHLCSCHCLQSAAGSSVAPPPHSLAPVARAGPSLTCVVLHSLLLGILQNLLQPQLTWAPAGSSGLASPCPHPTGALCLHCDSPGLAGWQGTPATGRPQLPNT